MDAGWSGGSRVVRLDAYRAPKAPTPPVVAEGVVDMERVRAIVAWSALAEGMTSAELAAAIEGVSAWRRRRPA